MNLRHPISSMGRWGGGSGPKPQNGKTKSS